MSSYLPPELLWACDLVPVRLRPGNSLAAADGYLPRNFSVEARALLAAALEGALAVDAVVFADDDDSSRRLVDVWRAYVKVPAFGPVALPRLANEAACARYAGALANLAAELVAFAGRRAWRPEDVQPAIDLYNCQRQMWQKLRALWVAGALSTGAWHDLRWLALTEAPHVANAELAAALAEAAGDRPSVRGGRRLAVQGAMDVQRQVLLYLEASGAQVVAEDSEADERTLTGQVPASGSPFAALASAYLNKPPGPRPAALAQRLASLGQLFAVRRVEGVLAVYPKFADAYLAEYAALSGAWRTARLPNLLLEQDRESGLAGQQRTRVEAFLEILEAQP